LKRIFHIIALLTLVLLHLISTSVVRAKTSGSVTQSLTLDQTRRVIFSDDFEDYPDGSLPPIDPWGYMAVHTSSLELDIGEWRTIRNDCAPGRYWLEIYRYSKSYFHVRRMRRDGVLEERGIHQQSNDPAERKAFRQILQYIQQFVTISSKDSFSGSKSLKFKTSSKPPSPFLIRIDRVFGGYDKLIGLEFFVKINYLEKHTETQAEEYVTFFHAYICKSRRVCWYLPGVMIEMSGSGLEAFHPTTCYEPEESSVMRPYGWPNGETGRWYKVKIIFDREANRFNVWIDDELLGSRLKPEEIDEVYDSISFICETCMLHTDAEIYIDDVKVFIPMPSELIPLIPQETERSCWAASSIMILSFYGTYGPLPTQIELARELGDENYYWDGLPAGEVFPIFGRWESTMERLGKLDFYRDVDLTFDEVIADINLNRPIMALYAGDLWIVPNVIPYHVVVIAGYIDEPGKDNDKVIIHDPWPPNEGTYQIKLWTDVKDKLWFPINAIRTKPQLLEGTILTLQEFQHKIYLHVYDEKGRHVGFNYDKNQVEEEIPNSRYLDLNGTILIVLPLNVTSFRCVVDAGHAVALLEDYTLIITHIKNGVLTSEFRKSDAIKQNEKQEFAVSILPDEREIKVELVNIPWWQASLYGIPLYLIITLIVIFLLSIAGMKIIKRKIAR